MDPASSVDRRARKSINTLRVAIGREVLVPGEHIDLAIRIPVWKASVIPAARISVLAHLDRILRRSALASAANVDNYDAICPVRRNRYPILYPNIIVS